MVRSRVISAALDKPALISAPTADVRFKATLVELTFTGGMRSELITWIEPPSKGIVLLTVVAFANSQYRRSCYYHLVQHELFDHRLHSAAEASE